MVWVFGAVAFVTITWLAYSRSQWKWRAAISVEQGVKLQRKVALLEHDLMRAEDVDQLWKKAQKDDPRAQQALMNRLQAELDGWGDERSGSR